MICVNGKTIQPDWLRKALRDDLATVGKQFADGYDRKVNRLISEDSWIWEHYPNKILIESLPDVVEVVFQDGGHDWVIYGDMGFTYDPDELQEVLSDQEEERQQWEAFYQQCQTEADVILGESIAARLYRVTIMRALRLLKKARGAY
jgi:hypothetical protein